MFSQTVEYALRAVVCLAQSPQKPLTTHQVAEVTRVPMSYLSKVLQLLGRAKIIVSTRGIHGGYTLAATADKISVLSVISAIDPIKRVRRCPLSMSTHDGMLCSLHRRIDYILEMTENEFRKTTVAELLQEAANGIPMCGMVPLSEISGGAK